MGSSTPFVASVACGHSSPTQTKMPRRCATTCSTPSGVIVRALADGLVMCPPLVIRDEHMDQLVDAVAAAAC